MKKICIVTSTRADYGLLSGIARIFQEREDVDFRFVATGTHLREFNGKTINAIIEDGFSPVEVTIDITGDRPSDILQTMSSTLINFSDYFKNNRPDLVVLLGDRFEIFCVGQASFVNSIPIAHIHGGELTEGAIDDTFRHALTKMSSLHFTSTAEYSRRVIQLGEDPLRVYNYGAPGLDSILSLNLLSKENLEKELNCRFSQNNVLITFHPVSVSEKDTLLEVRGLFEALRELPQNTSFFITMPNIDTYFQSVISEIEKFKEDNKFCTYVYKSLGQLRYLSMMKNVDAVVGNSSSGIIEAPFMGKTVVNVGNRQKGRVSSTHVIHTNGDKDSILKALHKALDAKFKKEAAVAPTFYGDGKSSHLIANEILSCDLSKLLPKKFYDLKESVYA